MGGIAIALLISSSKIFKKFRRQYLLLLNDLVMKKNDEKNSATGNKQSDFAGTQPDKYGPPKTKNEDDNPIDSDEAQNVTDDTERLSGKDAEHARNKATEGIKQRKEG
jgi:hypothetical protein